MFRHLFRPKLDLNYLVRFAGVQAYADSLLVIPKTLAVNAGLDAQETIVKLQEEYAAAGQAVGLDITSGAATGSTVFATFAEIKIQWCCICLEF